MIILTKNKIKNFVKDEKFPREEANRFMYRSCIERNKALFSLIAIIIIATTILLNYFIFVHNKSNIILNPSDYLSSDTVGLIWDKDNLLSTSERKELLDETKSTYGSIYKLYFAVTNEKNMKKAYTSVKQTFIEEKFSEKYFEKRDTIVVVYNIKTEEYFLYPVATIIRDTHIFDLIDTSMIPSSAFYEISPDIILATHTAYDFLFSGTPAENYHNVFNYINEHGYSETEVSERINSFAEKEALSHLISKTLVIAFASVVSVYILLSILDHFIEELEPTFIDKAIVESALDEIYRDREQNELKARAKEEKNAQEAARIKEVYEESHPVKKLIEAINKIQSNNNEINEKRDSLIHTLEIAESVLVNQSEPTPIVKRFRGYYLNAFQENINDILFHSQKHSTHFDTPEEIPVILKTFELYEKITTNFIDNSEDEGTQHISVNLTVLEQMASMDGLTDNPLKVSEV